VAEWMVQDLQECAAHGQKHGVFIGIQNHGDFLKTSEQVIKIIQMVDSEWFGTVVDTGAFRTADPYQDIATVAPYAVNWQIKEQVDLKRVVRIANEAGYRGYLPIETLPGRSGDADYDPYARAAQLLKELRVAIRET
jgi:sugar phosphate isomerase/epimerase